MVVVLLVLLEGPTPFDLPYSASILLIVLGSCLVICFRVLIKGNCGLGLCHMTSQKKGVHGSRSLCASSFGVD